jgi:hypothetical protein
MTRDKTGRAGRAVEFPGATTLQRELLTRLDRDAAGLTVRWDQIRGIVTSLRAPLGRLARRRATPEATVKQFLTQFGPLFGPERLPTVLRPLRARTDERGWTHLEYLQTVAPRARAKGAAGFEIYGAHLVAHVRDDGELAEVQSGCWRDLVIPGRPPGRAKVTPQALGKLLTRTAVTAPEYQEVEARMRKAGRRAFPLMRPPRLVVYPWQGGVRLAWNAYAYQDLKDSARGHGSPLPRLQLAQVFVDALTGERFRISPIGMHADTPVAGSGRGVTRSGTDFVKRDLRVVRVDQTAVHRLKDFTHARAIITYDLDGDSKWPGPQEMADAVTASSPSLPVSENRTGSAWATVAPPAVRTDSQQPEVDAHFFVGKAYEWYDALAGGRAGWDDGAYPTTTVPADLPVRVATHVSPLNVVNAGFDKGFDASGRWIPFLMLWDCDPLQACLVDGDRALDYFAGSCTIVGHEYQHAITAFSFIDGAGHPGIGYDDWTAAFHEGLSDTFGCLFSRTWTWGPEISPVGLVIRNAAFPRDPLAWENLPGTVPCGLGTPNWDHFADALTATDPYARGTVLAHCAFLLAAGGLHERGSRTPQYIPVEALDHETRGGLDFSRASRIWYDALTFKMQAYVTATGIPSIDSGLFRALRDACVEVAEDLFGTGSREHATTALAFYAVGLQPAGSPYGADVTFVRWAANWWLSRPYLGGMYGTAPDWASVDLFVNNGAGSQWNVVVNVTGSNGLPTTFENTVYCRVRNVGDEDALNVHVDLFYAAAGTAPVVWLPVADKNGASPGLTIAQLAAGQSSFPDADQQTPPASAGVQWCIPPLSPGTAVDHFCLKAVVTADNDVNPFNNEVQSNVTYVLLVVGKPFKLALWTANRTARAIPLELGVETTLPHGWEVETEVGGDSASMEPHEERLVVLRINAPAHALERLEPPFDGEITATLSGPLSGKCHGALTATRGGPDRLTGRVALALPDIGTLRGTFRGRLTAHTGTLVGQVTGRFDNSATGGATPLGVALSGRLTPWRRVNVSQTVDGHVIGGVTFEIADAGKGATPPE